MGASGANGGIISAAHCAPWAAPGLPKVATDITESILRHAGGDPSHTWIVFDDVAKNDWAVGGKFFDANGESETKSDDGATS